ncbi:MAG: hypothetical protein IBJ15_11825 [Alphaproteobacteria bacterium]|nr:hypothetical protein [Alphaproteobacteria bacterium]
MIKLDRCDVCGESAKAIPNTTGYDGNHWDCPVCSEYKIARSATHSVQQLDRHQIAAISGWLNEQNQFGNLPTLNTYNIETIAKRRHPTIPERAERYLKKAAELTPNYGGSISPHLKRLWGVSYCVHEHESRLLFDFLLEGGFLTHQNAPGGSARITPRGYVELERRTLSAPERTQGFVAMWFNPETNVAYEKGILPALEVAGFTPLRIDKKEHANKIDDEIVAEIRRSRFLVADFTGHRGGVYFEAGFAMGLNIPVFFTCRKDALKDLHFDIRQYNTIDWADEVELQTRLKNRIVAVIGEGPKARN